MHKEDAMDANSGEGLEEQEKLASEIARGRRALYQLRDLSAKDAAAVRRRAMEMVCAARGMDTSLAATGHYSFDAERAATQHCENFAGVAQVPLGYVGPLRVKGEAVGDELLYVPMATTEGALLASVNRGASAITKSGGARVMVEDVGMTRAPVFKTEGVEQAQELLTWLEENYDRVRKEAEGTSRFLRLEEVRPRVLGTTVLLRFRFTSGDAMGMNMATIACDRVVNNLIQPETGIPCIALSGNYCVDKKAAAVNWELGRGKRVIAEVVLPKDVVAGTLKSKASSLVEVQLRKNLHGSIAAGSMGFNAQFANALAAVFIATGQDLAHVVEGAMGLTHIEERAGGAVYASVYMPDLPLAAVGGGTGLATQREALDVLGVTVDPQRPGHAALRMAEIVGATVLAGELSLMAAFTSSDLASAHERLGRAKKPAGGASGG